MQSFQSFLAIYNCVKEAGIIKQFSQRVYTTVHLGLEETISPWLALTAFLGFKSLWSKQSSARN